jgi:hypothetical protein
MGTRSEKTCWRAHNWLEEARSFVDPHLRSYRLIGADRRALRQDSAFRSDDRQPFHDPSSVHFRVMNDWRRYCRDGHTP